MATTTHYGWEIPAVGTSGYAPKINTDLQDIDTDLFAVSEVADDAQNAADDAQDTADSAANATVSITPTVITPGGSGASLTATIDLSVGGPVYLTATSTASIGAQLTVTLTNRPATEGKLVYLHHTHTGGQDIDVKIASASKQWALPLSGDDVSATGTQALGNIASGSQAAYALYIVAGV